MIDVSSFDFKAEKMNYFVKCVQNKEFEKLEFCCYEEKQHL